MTETSTQRIPKSLFWLGMITIVACSLSLLAFFSNVSKRGPQNEIRKILSSVLAPSTVTSRLDRYVALGDDIAQVRRRLALTKERSPHNDRPKEWAFGLGGVSLILAIDGEGTVVGIGRHRPTDDGTIWFADPEWNRINQTSAETITKTESNT